MIWENFGYRISTIPIGIWHYLFNPLQILWDFPFIHRVDSSPIYVGFYGNGCKGIGVFSLNILMYLLFLLPIIRKQMKKDNKNLWNTILSLSIVASLMVCVITLMAASYGRYSLDFVWMYGIAVILLLLYILDKIKENEFGKKIFTAVVTTCITISVVFNALESINSEKNLFKLVNTVKFYEVQSTICFWE